LRYTGEPSALSARLPGQFFRRERKTGSEPERFQTLLLAPPLFAVGWWFLAWLCGFSGVAMSPSAPWCGAPVVR